MNKERFKTTVKEIHPEKKDHPLAGLYLSHNLQQLAGKIEGPLVIANYITDINGVIAKKDENGRFQVPEEIKNPHDWRLFQELEAQSDVIITATAYLKRFEREGDDAQNVFTQFDKGNTFEDLGDWRLENGLKSRHPDVAIVSRSLDFKIPEMLLSDRRVSVFTTLEGYKSERGQDLKKQGVQVVASGKGGVDGSIMINHLGNELGYNVIKMTTGPAIFKILLDSNHLDRLYLTQVQRQIATESEEAKKVLEDEDITSLTGFECEFEYIEEGVTTDDGTTVTQHFLVYDYKTLRDLENT